MKLAFRTDGRFGVRGRPTKRARQFVKLTYSDDGATSNTRLRVAGATPLLGELEPVVPMRQIAGALVAVWRRGSLVVTQRLTTVTGPTTQVPDTVRVDYLLWNDWSRARSGLGLRAMIDTLIGRNDGVPFLVPGKQGILAHSAEFSGSAVPDYVQALERESAVDPGAIVHITLRGGDATPPTRLVIDHWPGSQAGYEFFRGRGKQWGHDSAIGLHFEPECFLPGEAKRFTFFYGLGGMSSVASGNRKLALTFPRRVGVGDTFTVSARVFDPQNGESIALSVDDGLEIVGPAEQRVETVEGAGFGFLGWRVVARRPGERRELTLQAQDGTTEAQTVDISR